MDLADEYAPDLPHLTDAELLDRLGLIVDELLRRRGVRPFTA